MSKTITASERSRLIRLASTMDKGTPERKAILAGLPKTATAQARFKPLVKIKLSRITPSGDGLMLKGTLAVESGYNESPTPFVVIVGYVPLFGSFAIEEVVKPKQYTPAFTALLNAGLQEDGPMDAMGDALDAR